MNNNKRRIAKSAKRKKQKSKNNKVSSSSILNLISKSINNLSVKSGEAFPDSIKRITEILSKYHFDDAAFSLLIFQLWLPNTASILKFQLLEGLLASIVNSENKISINTYEEFSLLCGSLIEVLPSFPLYEDYIPELDWGQVKYPFSENVYKVLYGGSIERITDFIDAFRITVGSKSTVLSQLISRNPNSELAYVLSIQNKIIDAISNQPSLNSFAERIRPGHIETPSEEFWNESFKNLRINWLDILPLEFLNLHSIAAGTNQVKDLNNESFIQKIINDKWLPYLFLSRNEIYTPLSPRNLLSVFMASWFNLLNQLGAENISNSPVSKSLQSYLKLRLNENDGVFDLALIFHKQRKTPPIIYDSMLITHEKLFLIKILQDYRRETLESFSQVEKVTNEFLSSWPSPQFAIPKKGILKFLGHKVVGFPKIEFIYLIPVKNFNFGHYSVPKALKSIVLTLESFLAIVDSLRSSNKIQKYFEFMHENSKAFGGFIGPIDMLAAFIDSHGILESGAINYGMIGLDPHWGSNHRYEVLKDRTSKFQIFPDDSPESWVHDHSGKSSDSVLHRTDMQIYATHSSVNGTDFFAIADYSKLQALDGKLMEVAQECITDVFKYRKNIFEMEKIIFPVKRITFNLVVGSSVPESFNFSLLDSENQKILSLIVAHKSQKTLTFDLAINFKKMSVDINKAVDSSFETSILNELLALVFDEFGIKLNPNLLKEINKTSKELPRFVLNLQKTLVTFPDFIDSSQPEDYHFKLAKKHIAVIANNVGFKEGKYEIEEAKLLIGKIKNELIAVLNSKLSLLSFNLAIPSVLEKIEALMDDEWKSRTRIKSSMQHNVDYDRAKRLGEQREKFSRNHKNYRYLIEKLLEQKPQGTNDLTNDEFKELIAFIDWLIVFYSASDALHYGVFAVGLIVDHDITISVEYKDNIDQQEEVFRQEVSENFLEINTISNDIVNFEEEIDEYIQEIDQSMQADVGFKYTSLLITLKTLVDWMHVMETKKPSAYYFASYEQIESALELNDSEFNKTELISILDFITLTDDGLIYLIGESNKCFDIPIWEYIKRKQRYLINPLIKITGIYYWGSYSMSKALNIWSGNVLSGSLPSYHLLNKTSEVVEFLKKKIESRLVTKSFEVIKRYTDFAKEELFLHKKFPSKEIPLDLGDYDVLAYFPEKNVLLSIECKDNTPPYTLKDSKRLRNFIFGKSSNDSSQVQKILRRHQYLANNKEKIFTLMKWNSSDFEKIRVISLYVSRHTYWWFRYPPYEVNIDFIRIDLLDNYLQNL